MAPSTSPTTTTTTTTLPTPTRIWRQPTNLAYYAMHVRATTTLTGRLQIAKRTKFNAASAIPEGVEDEESSNSTGSSARSQLDLLEQLTSTSVESGYSGSANTQRPTIREQLSELVGDRGGEFTLPLGKRLKASLKSLTISQKRNIKRQAYLNEVSGRNDSVFFATIGAFVILPPIVILAVAVITGYVQLLP